MQGLQCPNPFAQIAAGAVFRKRQVVLLLRSSGCPLDQGLHCFNLMLDLLDALTIHPALQHDRNIGRKGCSIGQPPGAIRNGSMAIPVAVVVGDMDFQQAISRTLEQVQLLCNRFCFPEWNRW